MNKNYLDSCYICGKPFTFWDRLTFNITYNFEENSPFVNSLECNKHRRHCHKKGK